jgi:transposase
MDDAADKSLQANEPVVTESEVKDMRKRIRELERMLGRQTMRAEILEEALEIAGVKKPKLPGASSGFKGGR